jgi:uncharacterized protein (TIGR00297 family)
MFLSKADVFTGLVSIVIIGIILLVTETAVKKRWLSPGNGRKLLHIVAICTCAWAIGRFENRNALAWVFLAFFIILLVVVQKGWLQVSREKSYGIAFFPLAFSLLLFCDFFSVDAIVLSVYTLGICDAAAGWAGEKWGHSKILFWKEAKSWTGFAAFVFSLFLLALFHLKILTLNGLLACVVITTVPALTELFSYKGSDNFTIPIVTAAWLTILASANTDLLQIMALCIPVFIALCQVATAQRWLTASGAAAACWVGLWLMATGGLKAFIAPALFLISGSLLSKLNRHTQEKKGRNAVQVFANGLVGVVCLTVYRLWGEPVFLHASLVSFCISMSDSVSSELGMYFKGSTYDITGLKKMRPGVSGGISLMGTLAGLAGAAMLALAVTLAYGFSLSIFFTILIFGFAGMLADSVLGSLLQAKYHQADGSLTDDFFKNERPVKGYSWCGNDMVNLLANMTTTGSYLFFNLPA